MIHRTFEEQNYFAEHKTSGQRRKHQKITHHRKNYIRTAFSARRNELRPSHHRFRLRFAGINLRNGPLRSSNENYTNCVAWLSLFIRKFSDEIFHWHYERPNLFFMPCGVCPPWSAARGAERGANRKHFKEK